MIPDALHPAPNDDENLIAMLREADPRDRPDGAGLVIERATDRLAELLAELADLREWNAGNDRRDAEYVAVRAELAAAKLEAESCICRGNWRKIVSDNERFIGETFWSPDGKVWTFFGVVHGHDDYYYGMERAGELRLLSCVGSIDGHGYYLHDD